MKVRLRPRKIVVIRRVNHADVVLALFLSTINVIVGLLAFTILCCETARELGSVPDLRWVGNMPFEKQVYVLVAGLALLLAKLMGAYAGDIKKSGSTGDKLSAEG